MKKTFLCIFFIIIICLQGCSSNISRYINIQENTSGNYHFENLKNQILKDEPFTIEIFDCNFYKTYTVDSKYFSTVTNFIKNVSNDDFIKPIDTTKNKKEFEILIKFSNSTYYLNVFKDDVLSIYPYDGYVKSDFLKPKDMDLNYNLYTFCEFISNLKDPL